MNIETHVEQEVAKIREALAQANVSGFVFEIRASGRTMTGDVKIEYTVHEEYEYSKSKVSGNSIEPVIMEFLRRHGWDERNAPLAISYKPVEDDEIPF